MLPATRTPTRVTIMVVTCLMLILIYQTNDIQCERAGKLRYEYYIETQAFELRKCGHFRYKSTWAIERENGYQCRRPWSKRSVPSNEEERYFDGDDAVDNGGGGDDDYGGGSRADVNQGPTLRAANEGEFPFLVNLVAVGARNVSSNSSSSSNDHHTIREERKCSGTIIHDNLVITLASCIADTRERGKISSIKLSFGTNLCPLKQHPDNTVYSEAVKWCLPLDVVKGKRNEDGSLMDALAIIKLKQPLKLEEEKIWVPCWPPPILSPVNGSHLTPIGYPNFDMIMMKSPATNNSKQQQQQKIRVTDEDCSLKAFQFERVCDTTKKELAELMPCQKHLPDGSGCLLDSSNAGAPLVAYDKCSRGNRVTSMISSLLGQLTPEERRKCKEGKVNEVKRKIVSITKGEIDDLLFTVRARKWRAKGLTCRRLAKK